MMVIFVKEVIRNKIGVIESKEREKERENIMI